MQPGNPQWLDWVRDFQSEAEARDLTSAQAFKKAARSLSKCPVKMQHPSEALALQDIGKVTVDKIMAKLREHCKETGEDFPERLPADVLSAAAKRKKAAEDADEFNMGSDEDARLFKSKKRKPSNAPPKPRAPAKPKAAPKALTAKQKNQEKESQRNSAGNAAMARALAGMGSDDRRYEENEETRERRNEVTSSSSAHRDRELMAKKAARGDYAMQGVSGDQGRKQSSNSSMDLKPFEYFYLDGNDNRQPNRADAECAQEDGSNRPIYRIEFLSRQSWHSMATQLIRVEALDRSTPLPGPPTKSGYIRLRVSNDPSPGIARDVVSPVVPPRAVKELSAMDSLMGGQKNKSVVDKAAMYALPPGTKLSALDTVLTGGFRAGGSSARASSSSETIPRTKSAPIGTAKRPRSGDNDDEEDDEEESGKRISPSRSAPVKRASTGQGRILPPLPPGQHPYDPVVIPSIPFVAPEFDPIIIPAGTFKIILIVDTREVTGSKQDKDGFLKLLTKQGIHAEKRMLPLGDMIWVARRNDDETGKQDIMLDAIVERKRLDDLAMSIKDGRYADQKRRILQLGIPHKIYLVEEYDVKKQLDVWGKQIWTAKCQLQVNDGFYVRESGSMRETISYLKMRTTIMKDLYDGIDLHVLPDSVVARPTYLDLQSHLQIIAPAITHLTTYSTFERLTKMDASLTLRTQWATMVQCIKGMSAEKTVALVSKWSTPRSLFEAIDEKRRQERIILAEEAEEAGKEEEGTKKKRKAKRKKVEEFIAEEMAAGQPREIKGALSTKIYNMFAKRKYSD